jgi:integrase
VINPQQAKALLDAIAAMPRARRLVAFFGAIYYSALRPSEALALHLEDIVLPVEGDGSDGWGELLVSRNNPHISGAWNDTGRRTPRQLKHRARGEVRRVPVPPQLVELFRTHIAEFCRDGSPRVFKGPQGADINAATYTDVWKAARLAALTPPEAASPLARRPYDLRHAAVSTWLSAGVDSTQVAAWAGHSVLVLHRVYAHVLHGNEAASRRQIEERLQ